MLKKKLYDFQIPKKYIFIGSIVTAIGILTIVLVSNFVFENLLPKKLRIAAGKKTGESYIISQAIASVVADKTNIKIDVCETDGTDDNLKAIEGKELKGTRKECQKGKVDLATAQADRVLSNMPVRSIATLYEDHFQLLVKQSENFNPEEFELSSLKGKKIGTPIGGGQRQSLIVVAKQLEFFPFRHLATNDTEEEPDVDAIFYVRTLGHKDIEQRIRKGWRLVPIENVSALRNQGYYYYRNSTIPENNYLASVPSEELKTIAVDRLLLAQKDVPDWVIKKITSVLDNHDNDIENEIRLISNNKNQAVASLVRNIKKPSDDGDILVHPGVDAYNKSKEEAFLVRQADFFALILTISGLLYAGYLNLKNLQANEKIKQVIELIQESSDEVIIQTDKNFNEKELKDKLKKLFNQHKEVDKIFQSASISLDSGAFRAFSEVYKSTREMIERGIEDKQRRFSSYYVQQLVDIQKSQDDPNELSEKLEKKFIEIASRLLEDEIFSRESFLTFTEAYDIARDTIERKKASLSNPKNVHLESDSNSP